jgi:hypothetical protein
VQQTGAFIYSGRLSPVFSRDTADSSIVTFMPEASDAIAWPDTLRNGARWLESRALCAPDHPDAGYATRLLAAIGVD